MMLPFSHTASLVLHEYQVTLLGVGGEQLGQNHDMNVQLDHKSHVTTITLHHINGHSTHGDTVTKNATTEVISQNAECAAKMTYLSAISHK